MLVNVVLMHKALGNGTFLQINTENTTVIQLCSILEAAKKLFPKINVSFQI